MTIEMEGEMIVAVRLDIVIEIEAIGDHSLRTEKGLEIGITETGLEVEKVTGEGDDKYGHPVLKLHI